MANLTPESVEVLNKFLTKDSEPAGVAIDLLTAAAILGQLSAELLTVAQTFDEYSINPPIMDISKNIWFLTHLSQLFEKLEMEKL